MPITPANPANPMAPYMQGASHTHVDMTFPSYCENDGTPFQVNFVIKLFHTPGQITRIDSGYIRDIVWDATGTETPPAMVGDPMALLQWTGHATVDITGKFSGYAYPTHGWGQVVLGVQTTMFNGDNTEATLFEPVYSTMDLTAPEVYGQPMLAAHVNAGSANPAQQPPTQWGVVFLQFPGMVPIAPISAPWPLLAGMDSYGGTTLPAALFEQRSDINIHVGIPGALVATATMSQSGGLAESVSFDPAQLGQGTHNTAFIFNQPDRIQQVTALLVINVVVGAATPPPPTVTVPNVVGLTQAAALMSLMGVGLVSTLQNASDPMVPATNVISQVPAAGTMVSQDAVVTLTISTGPAMGIMVPNVIGMQCAVAAATLQAAGFKVISDVVTTQTPMAGSNAPGGSSVTIVC
jgi:PASTA domain-containing protein